MTHTHFTEGFESSLYVPLNIYRQVFSFSLSSWCSFQSFSFVFFSFALVFYFGPVVTLDVARRPESSEDSTLLRSLSSDDEDDSSELSGSGH